jgi:hypothetical protein
VPLNCVIADAARESLSLRCAPDRDKRNERKDAASSACRNRNSESRPEEIVDETIAIIFVSPTGMGADVSTCVIEV